MTDVVLTLPIQEGDEARLFGTYLQDYMQALATDSRLMSPGSEAPFLMVHSNPSTIGEVKVITFQETHLASEFSIGWDRARSVLA